MTRETNHLRRRNLIGLGGSTALVATAIGLSSAGTAQAAGSEDGILLDSFTGTDDERLTKAIAAQKASNPRRAIRLSARNHTFTVTRTTYSGMRIIGPNQGWQNPEISGTAGALPQCNVTLNCGTGNASWLVGTATTYDVEVSGICFCSSNGSTQFYHHPYSAGTAYATHLDSLTFYGFKHVLGMPGAAFAMTLASLSGVWTCVGVRGTQFSVRGSDNYLWVDVKAGGVTFRDLCLNFGMYRPSDFTDQTDSALVMVSGSSSRVLIDSVYTLRANGVPESVPILRVTEGVVCAEHIFGIGGTGNPWAGLPRVQRSGGTLHHDATSTLVTG